MKDPTRLLEASASDHERELLRAGAAEQPPSAAMGRLAQTLGVSLGTGELPSSGTQAVPAKLPLLAANKGMFALTVVTVGALSAVGWLAAHPKGDPGYQGDRATPSRVNAAQGLHQPASPRPQADAPPPPPSPQSGPAATAQNTNTLTIEIARIDAVRRDLAANRAKPAIILLQAYQRDFPTGVLRQEAELLNIEAHRQAGDRRRARTLASRFLLSNPDSPHSARVRDLLEDLAPDAR